MVKTKIIFQNMAHIGDIYLSQPFVKNIIDSNGDKYDYYIHCECNYFIFTTLFPNINILNHHHELYTIIQCYNNRDLLYYYDKVNNILILSTWYGTFPKLHNVPPPENLNLVEYLDFYQLFIERMNIEYNLNILFSNSPEYILPVFPKISIDTFFDLKKTVNKHFIFYYNVLACSKQPFPVNNHEEHLEIIKYIIKKDVVLLLPYKSDNIIHYIKDNGIKNIIFVDDLFNLHLDETCENIYYYAKVSLHCDTSFYFDTGRCFLYVNNDFIETDVNGCNRYHISNNPFCYNLLNRFFYKKKFSEYIACNDYNHIKDFISKII
jgi:hypothetical protein